MAIAEFSKFADILSAALSQHHLSGFEIAQLEYHHPTTARHFGMSNQVGLGSITMNKTSGDYRISAEIFQILRDDAVKVLHSIYQQIWKTQQWPQD